MINQWIRSAIHVSTAAALITLIGCHRHTSTPASLVAPTSLVTAPAPTLQPITDSKQFVSQKTLSDGLKIENLVLGKGPRPKAGQKVNVSYTGWLPNGTVFDSSHRHHQPMIFTLGQGQVIKGWDQGIAIMRLGGISQLIIPGALGYGESGMPAAGIAPNSVLIFRVHLLAIGHRHAPAQSLVATPVQATKFAPPVTDVKKFVFMQTLSDGLKIEDLAIGKGDVPSAGQHVIVNYTGWLTSGKVFDSSHLVHQPQIFRLGRGQVIKGWDEGMATMRVGGIRQLVVPAKLAYGKKGNAADGIPPNSILIFRIHLLGIE